MAKEKPISTSIRGNREYLEAVRRIAFRRNQVIADVVREGVDKLLGDELTNELNSFASGGHESVQSDTKSVEHVA